MNTFTLQLRPKFLPTFLAMLGWCFGALIVLAVLHMKFDVDIAATYITVPVAVGGTMFIRNAMSPTRVIRIAHGQFILGDGKVELDRFPLADLSRVEVFQKLTRNLQAFDRYGQLRVDLKPTAATTVPDEIADCLRRELPHLESPDPRGGNRPRNRRHRVITFPPGTPPSRPAQRYL